MALYINEVSFYRFDWTLAARGGAENGHLKPSVSYHMLSEKRC
jgi:hypothetical protein